MSLFGKLFGSDSIKNKMVDGIYNGLDAMVYTEEEKKENHKAFLKLYEPFKVAQRYLAIILCVPFSLLQAFGYSLRMYYWDNEALQVSISSIQGDMYNHLGQIVLMIAVFYYGGGTIEGGIKAFKSKEK